MSLTFNLLNASGAELAAGSEKIMSVTDIACVGLVGAAYFAFFFMLLRYILIPRIAKARPGGGQGGWDWVENHLSAMFCVVWFYGFITYFIGTFVGEAADNWAHSLLSVVPMAIIHATEMFVGQSDISAIHSDRHESVYFMMLFDTSHFFAIVVSMLFVFKHLGFYIASKYKLGLESKKKCRYDNIYLFWGVNDASLQLARSTIKHEKEHGASHLVVFVKTPLEDNDGNQRIGFGRLLNFISLKDRELNKLDSLESSIVISTFHKLSTLETSGDDAEKTDILRGRLKLRTLARLIDRLPDAAGNGGRKGLHIFFLGEDRDANINATINILKDSTIAGKCVNIYCQTRRNSKSTWMEHYDLLHPAEHTKIHIIDTAYLSVMQLKSDVEQHPVKFVSWDTAKGIPATTFSSLIIGFNETGLESLKFLYEFGTFVDEDGHRLPCACTVMDNRMDSIAAGFYTKAPAMKSRKEVSLLSCGVNDGLYWQTLAQQIASLNYVVIAAGNDNLGINAATDICNMAYRAQQRDATTRLTVFVRAYDTGNQHRLQKVADDTNRLYADRNIAIRLFGCTDDMFTFSMIIDDETLRSAKIYNKTYAMTSGELADSDADIDEVWQRTLGIKHHTGSYSLAEIDEIERKRNQNFCNCLHKSTKNEILRLCRQSDNPSVEMLTRLAQMEHERWVAYSVLNGWQRLSPEKAQESGVTKDTTHRLHADICPWEEIRSWDKAAQETTRNYDYAVVKTSIMLGKAPTPADR